mgnify:CR=1 FL=1
MAAILWGRDAMSLKPMLGPIPWVESAHPSPLSASRGVFGEALATPATGYAFVYGIEIVLLLATVAAMTALLRSDARRPAAAINNNQHQWSAP